MRPRNDPKHLFRPLLEPLETRTLPSVCTVDRLTDLGEGKGSAGDLRYCLGQAQEGDRVQFAVQGTIGLHATLPTLNASVTIVGPQADALTIRRTGEGDYRLLTVGPKATVVLRGLTLTDGFVVAANGGAILNYGALTVEQCVFLRNIAINEDILTGRGAGIFNEGVFTVRHSTFADNAAFLGAGIGNRGKATVTDSSFFGNGAVAGAGVYNDGVMSLHSSSFFANVGTVAGGAIDSVGELDVVNSTISGNVAQVGGGFINGGTMRIFSSTIVGNVAELGGGIWDNRTASVLRLRNTIVAGNDAPQGPDLDAALTSSGFNLIGDPTGAEGFDATDLLNVDPLLGRLQDNGGPTLTHALLPGSPALDAGDNSGAPEFDQRGLSRVVGGRIDIGAYEEQGRGCPSPGDVAALLALLGGRERERPDDTHPVARAPGHENGMAFAARSVYHEELRTPC